MQRTTHEEITFLFESNKIEQEYSIPTLSAAIRAWEYGKKHAEGICAKKILSIHQLLLAKRDPRIAGSWRDCAVMIGGRLLPQKAPLIIEREIEGWTIEWYPETEEDKIRQAHIEFEKIHPFADGNGRVGRILMNLQRLNAGLPVMVIHEGEEQQEYYKWFK